MNAILIHTPPLDGPQPAEAAFEAEACHAPCGQAPSPPTSSTTSLIARLLAWCVGWIIDCRTLTARTSCMYVLLSPAACTSGGEEGAQCSHAGQDHHAVQVSDAFKPIRVLMQVGVFSSSFYESVNWHVGAHEMMLSVRAGTWMRRCQTVWMGCFWSC